MQVRAVKAETVEFGLVVAPEVWVQVSQDLVDDFARHRLPI